MKRRERQDGKSTQHTEEDIAALEGVIIIETMMGNKYPVNTHGRDPEGVACLATRDIKIPCRVVQEGEHNE